MKWKISALILALSLYGCSHRQPSDTNKTVQCPFIVRALKWGSYGGSYCVQYSLDTGKSWKTIQEYWDFDHTMGDKIFVDGFVYPWESREHGFDDAMDFADKVTPSFLREWDIAENAKFAEARKRDTGIYIRCGRNN